MWTKTIFDDDMVPEKIKTDFKTIKACLKLIQNAKSDTTKIANKNYNMLIKPVREWSTKLAKVGTATSKIMIK